MLRVFKYFLAVLICVIVAVGVAGLIIAHRYQDDVKRMIVEGINRNVNTVIVVGDLSFSVLRRFPHASVEFRDIVIMAPDDFRTGNSEPGEGDTLFTARNLHMRFNMKDIFRGVYTINSIHANGGRLILAVNDNQKENYRFWKEDTSSAGNLSIDLQDVRFNDYRIKFLNNLKNVGFDLSVDRMYMKGQIGSSRYRLSGIASGSSREIRYGGIVFTGSREIEARVAVNVADSLFVIENGTIMLENISLTASGQYQSYPESIIDLNVRGYNIDLASAAGMLPASSAFSSGEYLFSGEFDFDASINGVVTKTTSPAVTAAFSSENGGMLHRKSGISIDKARVRGYYSNGTGRNATSSSVVVNSFSSTLGRGTLHGKGTLSDFSSPKVDFSLTADILLEELAGFYQPPNINLMSGRIKTGISGSGNIGNNSAFNIGLLRGLNLGGDLALSNGTIELSDGKYRATGIEGTFGFGKVLRTSGLMFNIGEDHFHLQGEIENGLAWLLGEDQVMKIGGHFRSHGINLDNYIIPSAGEGTGAAEPLQFPGNVDLNLDFIIERLDFRKFSSADFSGKLSYRPGMMVLNSIEFESMEGSVSGNGVIYQRLNGDFMVQSQLDLKDVDINRMFDTFGNFGQNFIDGSNLKGSLSGSVGLVSEWNNELRVFSEKIIADSRLVIENGELIDFKPVLGLSRFIDVSELQHIRFSTLQNEIFIRNRLLTIPQMDINSTAFNISGAGTHDFDGNFDYRMRVLLSDVLYGKARRSRPETEKYGIVEDDGLGRTSLYLAVSGNTDDYRVTFDHRAVREVIRDNIAAERSNLRQILNEEFGWFGSGGQERVEKVTPERSTGFRIIWEEEDERARDTSVREAGPDRRQQENRPRFRIEWDEEEKPGK
ncbi:MAG: hypothetical protein EA408_08380 [Marinilabiliales bacterium]|nr:MAG: hypothetical protein EA408_08380 [Marinilabiliales bacterium]